MNRSSLIVDDIISPELIEVNGSTHRQSWSQIAISVRDENNAIIDPIPPALTITTKVKLPGADVMVDGPVIVPATRGASSPEMAAVDSIEITPVGLTLGHHLTVTITQWDS